MKLIVLHYHFRPGGVRSVIEAATPFLPRALPAIKRIVFAGGEARDAEWNARLCQKLAPLPAEFFLDPAFAYASEQTRLATLADRIRAALARLLDGGDALVWAHNLAIARNLPLARELTRACAARGLTLLAHHHDWWFDHRWLRWPEMRRTGFRTLPKIARAIFPATANVRFAAINRADAGALRRHFGARAQWLPNPAQPAPPPSAARVRFAKKWLREKLREDAPVWLMPGRVLRRKNIAEALLLARWLRPEAMLVTTGVASSADEQPYARRLAEAARAHGWRLHLGVLAENEAAHPTLPELLAASECVPLTSIQEGFGLAALEAAAAARPLLARRLPNIAPDLARFGFRFPHSYREILIAPAAFDWEAERRRQRALFREWKNALPQNIRALAGPPLLLQHAAPRPVPFSRLTLTAQLEVLAHPAADSWKLCAPWNPRLRKWKAPAAAGCLQPTPWPATADAWLDGAVSARRLAAIFQCRPRVSPRGDASVRAQAEFIRLKLRAPQLFPLLFHQDS